MARVFLGMSGGVDSSLSASLLLEAGHQVVGVYMKNWSQDLPGARCPWAEDLADAKRVAVRLGIDFRVYDFEKEYKSRVVDYMIAEYRAGRTPNPDIMCNQEVKFKLFVETALSDGADLIATGHYAQVRQNQQGSFELLQAVDQKKDQTYFLYRVSQEALSKTLFPIGHLQKSEVRELAQARGLITAQKKDSVGICFVGQVSLEEFLSQYIDLKPGKFIEAETGKELGWHKGVPFYTLGQRHGLDLGGGLPYYVVAKSVEQNEVLVSRKLNQGAMWTERVELSDLHWINSPDQNGQTYQVRTRHQASLVPARLNLKEVSSQEAELVFETAQRAITPGQSVVVYDGEICLGGGIVK